MTDREYPLYKIEYVEMTPAEAEESEEGLEILEVIAEVDGDPFDAINSWAKDMEWSIVNYRQVKEGIPFIYLSPTGYIELEAPK
ncbi:hypothetical protein H6G97_50090 [Nostoc flagelliforme FACHB-838]|uniref:Uncharacterized protein n=1 Tax=Nostoc flagelliforme FACHB-838 TaxID=2692904 RepID=A0ABR8E5H3_9NOSO|nr:hypothetical protein [Nostoc flagelliforme]MBD2536934.1 hypothetical protein [Nostoc flagelliforme FACHB-838]